MKLLLILGLCFLFNNANAQLEDNDWAIVIMPDGSSKVYTNHDKGHHNDRDDGLHIRFYDSLRTKVFRTFYLKGRYLNGFVHTYNRNGVLIKLENYENGLENGDFYFWSEKGRLFRIEHWFKGKLKSKKRF